MEPEEIDNLFKERLGRMAPAPSPDLFNRLQDRMEAEMPQHQQKRRFGFLYYSIAAAITLLLAVGVVLKLQQPQVVSNQTIAQNQGLEPLQTITPEVESKFTPDHSIAAVTPIETEEPATTEPAIIEQKIDKPVRKQVNKQAERWVKMEETRKQPAQFASQDTKPEQSEIIRETLTETPVAFAAAKSAEPVEIVIKRAITPDAQFVSAPAETNEEGDFKKKQRLAKNIFKQVRNLTNGEEIDFKAIGVDKDRLAFEPKTAKEKLSKVINL